MIYDRVGSYAPMYLAACGMGLMAMLILAAFRPFPRRPAALAVA
jgi:hypothetical protein